MKARAWQRVVGEKVKPSNEFKSPKTIHKRKRSRTGNKLTLAEKIEISHKVICQNELQADIAKEYRITRAYVSMIVNRSLKNPKYIEELRGEATRQ